MSKNIKAECKLFLAIGVLTRSKKETLTAIFRVSMRYHPQKTHGDLKAANVEPSSVAVAPSRSGSIGMD